MKLSIVIISVLVVASLHAIAPPKKGIAVPKNFAEKQQLLAKSYPQSGLARSMQYRKSEIRRLNRMSGLTKSSAFPAPPVIAIPVLLGEYSNTSARFSAADMSDMLFGDIRSGSMIDYYDEISYGLFSLSGTVYDWTKLANDQSFYVGADNGGDGEAARFCYDLALAQDEAIDFSLYDSDGPDGIPNSGDDDGYVDVLVVVHTGGGAETGDNDNIWSHRWSFSSANHFNPVNMPFDTYTSNDSAHGGGFIKINDYIVQPEQSGSGLVSDPMIDIGVFCHEFAHALGLPDLYDIDPDNGESAGIGFWGLMAAGSYGGDGQHSEKPSHMCAWSKEFLGWLEPAVIDSDLLALNIPEVETNSVAYKVQINNSEYFLIENRAQVGFDAFLKNAGLCVWHIDDKNAGTGNGDADNKLVDLEEADGLRQLDIDSNSGDAGDVYPGQRNNREFGPETDPNSNANNGGASYFTLSSISDASASMSADFLFADPPPDSTTVLYYEDFEGGLPTDWIIYDQDGDDFRWGAQSEFDTGEDVAYTGDMGVACDFNRAGNDDWLITPPGSLPADAEITFSFVGRSRQSSWPEDFNVLLSTTGTAVEDFTNVLDTVRVASENWTNYSYDISAFAGETVHLAIQLVSVDKDNLYLDDFEIFMQGVLSPTSISEIDEKPEFLKLLNNYPNPFNPMTNIRYSLPEAGAVSLVIYDIAGREIMTLVDQQQSAGWYNYTWNGLSSNGIQVDTGVYFARIEAGKYSQVIKMVYLK